MRLVNRLFFLEIMFLFSNNAMRTMGFLAVLRINWYEMTVPLLVAFYASVAGDLHALFFSPAN